MLGRVAQAALLAGLVALAPTAATARSWGIVLGPARERSSRPLAAGWYRLPGWQLQNPSSQREECTIVVQGPAPHGVRVIVLPRRLRLDPHEHTRLLAGLYVSPTAAAGRYRYRIIVRVRLPGRSGKRVQLQAQVALRLQVAGP